MISNSGHDENGRYAGGTAGDQGGEWTIIPWYSRPWNCVLRHPDEKVRKEIARLSRAAAVNDKIGYDQNQRDSYWGKLQAAGYEPSRITTACEADCSAGVIANTKAAGYLLGNSSLKTISATYTGNMRSAYKAAGFAILTAQKYLATDNYLLEGDILLNDAYHTAVNLTDGKYASEERPQQTISPVAPDEFTGECQIPAHTFLVGAKHPEIKTIQRLLNARGYKGADGKTLSVDGHLGQNTAYAIKTFQQDKGMKEINYGTVAAKTWEYLLREE